MNCSQVWAFFVLDGTVIKNTFLKSVKYVVQTIESSYFFMNFFTNVTLNVAHPQRYFLMHERLNHYLNQN